MAIGITITSHDLETLSVDLSVTGLSVGIRYDVYRLQLRFLGYNDLGKRIYERELPDRLVLWSSVAHRVGWKATSTSHTFRDYETPVRPTVWFIVPSESIGPVEYADWSTPYPIERGAITPYAQAVHFAQDEEEANLGGGFLNGTVVVRSTDILAQYAVCCVVDIDVKYVARGTEMAVIGKQFPIWISDTREARRGTLTLLTSDIGQYDALRTILFPSSGLVRPVQLNSGGSNTLLLDDMRLLPLDVSVEQATHANSQKRYIHVDFIETDPSVPLIRRIGDNDTLVSAPTSKFAISDTTPARRQWVTLSDAGTGQYDTWDWSIGDAAHSSNKVGHFYTRGPHKVYWALRGKKNVKLKVSGPAGASTRTLQVTVH